ncbi:MAG: hypothetical protein WKF97_06160 [Chitinophagaceae bacterium]
MEKKYSKQENRKAEPSVADRLFKAPAKTWKFPVSDEEPVFNYRLRFEAESSQTSAIQVMLRDNPFVDFNNPVAGEFLVHHAVSNTRVECIGKSVHGADFIYITDKTNGFLFIDKTTKTYLHLQPEKMIKYTFKEKLNGMITMSESGDKGYHKAVLTIDLPRKIRYEFLLDANEEWKPYTKQVLKMIMGCPTQLADAGTDLTSLYETGMPFSGNIYYEISDGQFELMTSFTIDRASIQKKKKDLFGIPPAYKNIRQLKKKKVQFPAVRLSDFRKNRKPGYAPHSATIGQPATDMSSMTGSATSTQAFARQGSGLKFPTCFDETYGALISNLIDQKLLDDSKYLVNTVSKRLAGFSGSGGEITINWMEQFKSFSDALSGQAGSGLYTLLHDEAPTDYQHPTKRGLLDMLAIVNVGKLFTKGQNFSNLALDASLQNAIDDILTNNQIAPTDRYANLTAVQQGQLVDAYLFKGIGTIRLNYPSSLPSQDIFYGLLGIKLTDVAFVVGINNRAVVDTLAFDSDSIHLILKNFDLGGQAWVLRWPTARYFGVLALSGISCFFFPFTCFLLGLTALVGLFLATDIAFATLSLDEVSIDGRIEWVPDGANVLHPQVSVSLDAEVSVSYNSVLPTGIHQILSIIYSLILSHTDTIISMIETDIREQFNDFFENDLSITYPPPFGPVPLSGISNRTDFSAGKYAYIEQVLNAGLMGVINPYITQVDGDIEPKILKHRDNFLSEFTDPVVKWAEVNDGVTNDTIKLLNWQQANLDNVERYYFGTVLSQNFVNDYLHTLWRRELFNYDFTTDETAELFQLLQEAFPIFTGPEFGPGRIDVHVHLWPAVSPRILFTPRLAATGEAYSTTFFDDIRICFEIASRLPLFYNKIEIAFAAQVFSEIGFGGYNQKTGQLDLLKVNDRVFDIYFDTVLRAPKIIHHEVEYFVVPGMQPSVSIDYSALEKPAARKLLILALSYAFANRSNSVIPRVNPDPMYVQKYPLGTGALHILFQLLPFRGNLYINQSIGGLATAALEGALNIDNIDQLTGTAIRDAIAS